MIDPINPDFSNPPSAPGRPTFHYTPVDLHSSPSVTIITPFFNTGAVFHETALCVLGQSLQQFEWLIINDGSTDPEALAILDQYRTRDPRIRVIDLPHNRGLSAARNAGFNAAQSAYVLQLDSDDLIEPTTAETWVWFLESYPMYAFVKGFSVGFGAQEYVWRDGFHNSAAFLEDNRVNATCLIRVAVHQAVGGYDETRRGGLEDWDFWLRCANAGYWGATIPQFFDWYRRRETHADRWGNWDAQGWDAFRQEARRKYPQLWKTGIPVIALPAQQPYTTLEETQPFVNLLACKRPRVLILMPWFAVGGAEKFVLDLICQLIPIFEYEITIATTLGTDVTWLPEFSQVTPDIFVLPHFLSLPDYPRFLRYLMDSRQIDILLIANSYLGFLLLPYLRASRPQLTTLTYVHMEEEYWKNGGYPRAALNAASQLDMTIVSSEHLREWMIARGGNAEQIAICTTNIDPEQLWNPKHFDRATLRAELEIPPDIPVILYAARLAAQKRPLLCVQVLKELTQQNLPFIALIVGDGEARPTVDAYVAQHGLKHVRVLGVASQVRIKQLLAVADIFFLPSEMEGIALAIYEAMAMGLAVVAADVGGQRELVTPECGVLVAPGEGELLAYIAILKELLQESSKYRTMGKAARERIRAHYRLEHMGQRMASLITEAQQRSMQDPRRLADWAFASEIATQVIEYTRLEQEYFRIQVEGAHWHNEATRLPQTPLLLFVARKVKKKIAPLYHWLVGRGLGWLRPLRDLLFRIMSR